MNLDNIPKASTSDITTFLDNAPPELGKYLSMCSEMLQAVMAAQVQQASSASGDAADAAKTATAAGSMPDAASQSIKSGEPENQQREDPDGKRINDADGASPAQVPKRDE